MKIFHIESGLGNQMLDYADLLASRLVNNNEVYYIETILYDLNDKQNKISMWNGYELERVFGIKEKNVKSLFSDEEWNFIIKYVADSEFWNHGWGYSEPIINAFEMCGLRLTDRNPHLMRKDSENHSKMTFVKYIARQLYYFLLPLRAVNKISEGEKIFLKSSSDDYNGHYLKLMYKGNGLEKIDAKLRESFIFPELDDKNSELAEIISTSNSVSIHARRGDFLSRNSFCYKYGYFKRAVKYIKARTDLPIFVLFCDSGNSNWCRENIKLFGLNHNKDNVLFVDWNTGLDSYKDMQLMSMCKHNIITNSSFGWWGAFLNSNKNKITCSCDARIVATNWF